MRLAAFDLETTGFLPRGRIVEVGWADSTGFRQRLRVDPEHPIPPRTSAVHGLTDADVAGAPTILDAMPQTLARLAYSARDGGIIVGYNLRRFDLPMLRNEAERAGMRDRLQAIRLERVLDLYPWLGCKLEVACRERGIAPGGHHADTDAEATLNLALYLHGAGEIPEDWTEACRGPKGGTPSFDWDT